MARSSLSNRPMRRVVRAFPLITLVVLGISLFFRRDGREAAPDATVPPNVDSTPGVQIEHTLVTANVVENVAPHRVVIPRQSGAIEPPHPRRTATAAGTPRLWRASQGSVASKTRRILLGDGRHKPQPFPRVNN